MSLMRGNGGCRAIDSWDVGGLLTKAYRFKGPKITLNLDDLSESQERALEAEGLEIETSVPARSQSMVEAHEKKMIDKDAAEKA